MSKKPQSKIIWSEFGNSERIKAEHKAEILYLDDFVRTNLAKFIPVDDPLASEDEEFRGKTISELYEIVYGTDIVISSMGIMAPHEVLEYAAKAYDGGIKEYRRALQDIQKSVRAFNILSNVSPELVGMFLESKGKTLAEHYMHGTKLAKYFVLAVYISQQHDKYKPAYDAVRRELEPLGVLLIESLYNKVKKYAPKDDAQPKTDIPPIEDAA